MTCELCGEEVEGLTECEGCGRMVCNGCLAFQTDDDRDERGTFCEKCF